LLTLEYTHAGVPGYLPIGDPEEIPMDVPNSDFPLIRAIPLAIFAEYEGTFKFRYRVGLSNGGDTVSIDAPVTIDRTGPIRPNWPESMRVDESLITDATLLRDGGVKCEVPDFIEDKKDFVRVVVGWMSKFPETEAEFPELVAYNDLLPPNRVVTVPAKFVTGIGSQNQYVVYFLFDKAGNRSEMSFAKLVPVALGELPSALKPCSVPLADDGLIDRADAAFPTWVVIPEYSGWQGRDGIEVLWGSKYLARTSVENHGSFPLRIEMPWVHMEAAYDFDSSTPEQPVAVDYKIFRGDYAFDSPGEISVNTNFKIPGPDNPSPEPINDLLKVIRFQSSQGSDRELILPGDDGQDATGFIELSGASVLVAGDVLTLYYNGIAVSSPPYIIQPSDAPGTEIPISIPWADIERTLVMDALPLHYTLTRPGLINPQESPRTYIKVELEKIELPPAIFPLRPGSTTIHMITCEHLLEENGEWGVHIKIPASQYLLQDVNVELSWRTYAADGTTALPGTEYTETITVSAAQQQNGIDWFIPNTTCLMPTFRPQASTTGQGKVTYSINVRGTPVPSPVSAGYILVYEDTGSGVAHCKLTRPPRTP
jgi:hypothetical protein